MTHLAKEFGPDDDAWNIAGQCYFHSKVAVGADTCVFLSDVFEGVHDFFDPADPYSLFYRYSRGQWRCVELSARLTSITRYRASGWTKDGIAILDEAGEIWMLGDDASQMKVDHPVARLLGGIHVVNGSFLVTGYGGQVYRQERDRWVHDDEGMYETVAPVPRPRKFYEGQDREPGAFSCSLVAQTPVHGELYAAGAAYGARPSLFWRPQGQTWQWLDLTSRHPELDEIRLTGIFAETSEEVWVSTDHGVLFKGNGRTGFEVVCRDARDADGKLLRFTQPRLFEGQLYVGGTAVCRILPNGSVERLTASPRAAGRNGGGPNRSIEGTLDVADGVLWAIGDKGLARFDGSGWDFFSMPPVNRLMHAP